ncbi:hypothetical protein BGX27_009711 [Mortierella sp. AM989]|nr:hypothetical protein BGX27_009711 [Mortierella sp. AM989]
MLDSAVSKVFDVPELLSRISQRVTLKDALACARVCKAWKRDFTITIWHTIDFATEKSFTQVDKKMVTKYGCHIRALLNVKENTHIDVIQNSAINRLSKLTLVLPRATGHRAHCLDILKRNSGTLEELEVSQADNSDLFFPIDFMPIGSPSSSNLTSIKFQRLTITRAALVSLLRASPKLAVLDLRDSKVLPSTISDTFQLRSVFLIVASATQIFQSSTQSKDDTPSLLAHFPNLRQWRVSNEPGTVLPISGADIKAQVTRYCPVLWNIYVDIVGPPAIDLIANGFHRLSVICVAQDQLSPKLILAVITHKSSLNEFRTFVHSQESDDDEDDDAPAQLIGRQAPSWAIHQIPANCDGLSKLKLPDQAFDLVGKEMFLWSCKFLNVLHIRIVGLDTKSKIDRAIQLYKEKKAQKKEKEEKREESRKIKREMKEKKKKELEELKKKQKELMEDNSNGDGKGDGDGDGVGNGDGESDSDDDEDYDYVNEYSLYNLPPETISLEERVAVHLLRFRYLREVCLGTKVYNV